MDWAKDLGMKAGGYEVLIQELTVHYQPLVEHIAAKVSWKLLSYVRENDLDDMVNDGMIGLMEALHSYDPARGVKFETYASHRIWGAILDELRKTAPDSRWIRKMAKSLQEDGEMAETAEGVASALQVPLSVAKRIRFSIAGKTKPLETKLFETESGPVYLKDTLMDPKAEDPSLEVERKDLVRHLTAELDPQSQQILSLYYGEGLTMLEIGKRLDRSEPWVSKFLIRIHDHMQTRGKELQEGRALMRLDTFPNRIRYARLANGFSQRGVSRAARIIERRTVSSYERGELRPGPGPLERLAAALGVPVEWLAKGEGVPPFLERGYLQSAGVTLTRIEEERKRRVISDRKLARQAGLAYAVYALYVRGEVVPTPEVLKRLQEALASLASPAPAELKEGELSEEQGDLLRQIQTPLMGAGLEQVEERVDIQQLADDIAALLQA